MINRRQFVNVSTGVAVALGIAGRGDWWSGGSAAAETPSPTLTPTATAIPPGGWRVAVIGHTGRGNYGHALDTLWLSRTDTQIVAVADADPAGLTAAKRRLQTDHGFADYRQMLNTVDCDIVAVCPRHLDQHCEMMVAAAEAGAKAIYAEKPFCRTPAEADAVRAACNRSGTKVAFAHRNRYHPALPTIKRLIDEGVIGKPLEIRGRGKGDHRGGGEDLWVLGSHVLNLIHYLAGEPRSCSAVMLQDGRPATAADIRQGGEAVGPIAGNALHARYLFDSPLVATFDSQANDQTAGQAFGLRVIGSEGIIDIKCDCFPLAYFIAGNPWAVSTAPAAWQPISSAGVAIPEPIDQLQRLVMDHTLTIDDLLSCLGTDRQPLCDLHAGATTVEMISAVFASHQAGGLAVELPLNQREHPLVSNP